MLLQCCSLGPARTEPGLCCISAEACAQLVNADHTRKEHRKAVWTDWPSCLQCAHLLPPPPSFLACLPAVVEEPPLYVCHVAVEMAPISKVSNLLLILPYVPTHWWLGGCLPGSSAAGCPRAVAGCSSSCCINAYRLRNTLRRCGRAVNHPVDPEGTLHQCMLALAERCCVA